MSATKILWGQITVVFLIILITTWGATQYVAWSLGFQAQLGTPWFELSGVPIYYPPAVRRQKFWDSRAADLVEGWPRLGLRFRRRFCGAASADVRGSGA